MIFVGAARSILGAVVEQLHLLGRGQDPLQDVAELLDLVVELEVVLLCADEGVGQLLDVVDARGADDIVEALLVALMPTMSLRYCRIDLQVQLGDVPLFDLDLAQVHLAQLAQLSRQCSLLLRAHRRRHRRRYLGLH